MKDVRVHSYAASVWWTSIWAVFAHAARCRKNFLHSGRVIYIHLGSLTKRVRLILYDNRNMLG